jgi:hypothetical protein
MIVTDAKGVKNKSAASRQQNGVAREEGAGRRIEPRITRIARIRKRKREGKTLLALRASSSLSVPSV